MIAIDDQCSKITNILYSRQIHPFLQTKSYKCIIVHCSLRNSSSSSNRKDAGWYTFHLTLQVEKAHLLKHVRLLSRQKLVNESLKDKRVHFWGARRTLRESDQGLSLPPERFVLLCVHSLFLLFRSNSHQISFWRRKAFN